MSAAIVEDPSTIDPFTTEATTVSASSLRECMVLMDAELGTPLMWLDHRVRAARDSGGVAWLAFNLETERLETVMVHANVTLRVLARKAGC